MTKYLLCIILLIPLEKLTFVALIYCTLVQGIPPSFLTSLKCTGYLTKMTVVRSYVAPSLHPMSLAQLSVNLRVNTSIATWHQIKKSALPLASFIATWHQIKQGCSSSSLLHCHLSCFWVSSHVGHFAPFPLCIEWVIMPPGISSCKECACKYVGKSSNNISLPTR